LILLRSTGPTQLTRTGLVTLRTTCTGPAILTAYSEVVTSLPWSRLILTVLFVSECTWRGCFVCICYILLLARGEESDGGVSIVTI
jgi:hypothetical protein